MRARVVLGGKSSGNHLGDPYLGLSGSRENTDHDIATVVVSTLIRIVRADSHVYDDLWIDLACLVRCVNTLPQAVQTPCIYHFVRARAGLENAGEGSPDEGSACLRDGFAIVELFWFSV